jgi:hypothetical protein
MDGSLGSCEEQSNIPNLLGGCSVTTSPTAQDIILGNPCGERETNTITQAELAAYYAALKH